MGRTRHGPARRGNAIVTRISIDALNTSILVDGGKTLVGWKPGLRRLLQRESERLRRIAAMNMAFKNGTDPIPEEEMIAFPDSGPAFVQSVRLTAESLEGDKGDFWTLQIWDSE
jgi:hypothetical protein